MVTKYIGNGFIDCVECLVFPDQWVQLGAAKELQKLVLREEQPDNIDTRFLLDIFISSGKGKSCDLWLLSNLSAALAVLTRFSGVCNFIQGTSVLQELRGVAQVVDCSIITKSIAKINKNISMLAATPSSPLSNSDVGVLVKTGIFKAGAIGGVPPKLLNPLATPFVPAQTVRVT